MNEVQKNADSSTTIYFGPVPEKGKENNWLRTDPERRFFILGRFYGPEPELLNGSFELNDMEYAE